MQFPPNYIMIIGDETTKAINTMSTPQEIKNKLKEPT